MEASCWGSKEDFIMHENLKMKKHFNLNKTLICIFVNKIIDNLNYKCLRLI